MKNLILQANHLAVHTVDTIAALSEADRIEPITQTAVRLINIVETEALIRCCQAEKIDYAIVPASLSLSDYGLLACDMDSTLITVECIDEMADIYGEKDQVAVITEAAMMGEMDFAESLRKRVALLAGLTEDALWTVYEKRLSYNPGAQTLIDTVKQAGLKTLLVSGGFSFFTQRVINALGMDAETSNELEIIDGKLTGRILGDIIDAKGKANALIRLRDQMGLHAEQTIAIGDGANDLLMLKAAGLSIAYHAKPKVASGARYAINQVGLDGVLALFAS